MNLDGISNAIGCVQIPNVVGIKPCKESGVLGSQLSSNISETQHKQSTEARNKR